MGMVEVARDFLGNLFSFDQAHPLLFTQFYFWAFFALVLAMLCVFRNKILLRNACLFAVSLFFYYKTSGLFLLLLLFVVAFNYLAGLLIPRIRGKGWRKAVLAAGIVVDLSLLFYYKCVDQRMDDRSLRGKAGESLFRKPLEKLRKDWPLQTEDVEKALSSLWEEEKRPDPVPDMLCNLSGEMLGSVFVPFPEDPWSGVLRSLGAGLGRFIYWMDAWEDFDADRKKSRFNPLTRYRDRADYEDFCRETLELLIAEAVEYFEVLPLEQDLDILRNILYSGVWQRYTLITEKAKRKEEAHAE